MGIRKIWVNNGPGNGLLFDVTKPLPDPMWTYMYHQPARFCGIHLEAIVNKMLSISILKINLKITLQYLLPYHLGYNELNVCECRKLSSNHVVLFQMITMTLRHGNVFRFNCPLWGESTGHRQIPLTKAHSCGTVRNRSLSTGASYWTDARFLGDLRRHSVYVLWLWYQGGNVVIQFRPDSRNICDG